MKPHIIDELRPTVHEIGPEWQTETVRAILGDTRHEKGPTVGRHRSARVLLAIAAAAAVLGGVVVARDLLPGREASPAPSTAAAPTQAQLFGRWGADPATAQEQALPWLRFDYDGTVGGFDSCNQVGGTWALDRSAVRVDIQSTTLIACRRGKEGSPVLSELGFDGANLTYKMSDGTSKTMVAADDEPLMYLLVVGTKRLEAVPAPVHPDGKPTTPEQRAVTAVQEMMKVPYRQGARYSSFWDELCRLGDGVKSVEMDEAEQVAVVRFARSGGALCDLVRGGDELRSQQIAWTVVTNLGVDRTTAVRLVGPGQEPLADDIVTRTSVLQARP